MTDQKPMPDALWVNIYSMDPIPLIHDGDTYRTATTRDIAPGNTVKYIRADLDDWQPIETAPKDGTQILAYSPGRNLDSNHVVVRWIGILGNTKYNCFTALGRGYISDQKPTHWRPLPNPPKE